MGTISPGCYSPSAHFFPISKEHHDQMTQCTEARMSTISKVTGVLFRSPATIAIIWNHSPAISLWQGYKIRSAQKFVFQIHTPELQKQFLSTAKV